MGNKKDDRAKIEILQRIYFLLELLDGAEEAKVEDEAAAE